MIIIYPNLLSLLWLNNSLLRQFFLNKRALYKDSYLLIFSYHFLATIPPPILGILEVGQSHLLNNWQNLNSPDFQ